MTEQSYFTGTSGSGDAGPYSAAQLRALWKRVLGFNADDPNRGVMRGVANELEVEPSSPAARSVVVKAGAAVVSGAPYYNDTDLTLSVDPNTSGYDRVDRVVLELDFAADTVRAVIVKGPEDGSDVPATLVQNTSYWQIPLARLDCDNGYATLTASEIEDDRLFANLPPALGVEMTNSSGSEITVGTLVKLDTTAQSVTTTSTQGSADIVGVAAERIGSTASGKVIMRGAADVRVTGAVSVGDPLQQSATAGVAEAATGDGDGVIGWALESNASGDGIIQAWLAPRRHGPADVIKRDNSSAYTTTSATFVDVDATNLAITITTHGGPVLVCFAGSAAHSDNTNGIVHFDVDVDGTRYGDSFADGICQKPKAGYDNVSFAVIVNGLDPGSHTFKLQWREDGTGTAYLQSDPTEGGVFFSAVEL